MSILHDLIEAGVAMCKAKCGEVQKKAQCIGAMIGLCVAATILALWGVALLIAAVFIGLAPHLGAGWAAVICAGIAFFLAAILMLVAMIMRK